MDEDLIILNDEYKNWLKTIKPFEKTGSFNDRVPNLNPEIINSLSQKLGLRFSLDDQNPEEDNETTSPVCYANSEEISDDFKMEILPRSFASVDILNYIYAVLFSHNYKDRHDDFLKTDAPGLPYPNNQFEFWRLVKLGGELRKVHLLEYGDGLKAAKEESCKK